MYYKDKDYIKCMNKTYSKTFSQKSLLPKYIASAFKDMKFVKILDYGAGKDAFGTMMLRDEGFNVTAYDVGENCIEGVHDPMALHKKYDLVFASNVINVQPSYEDIRYVLKEIYLSMENHLGYGYSAFYCNLPESPRKCDIDNVKLRELLSEVFGKENKAIVDVKTNLHRGYKYTMRK